MDCPEFDQLKRFVRSILSEPERSALQKHVAKCDDCNRRITEVASNLGAALDFQRFEPAPVTTDETVAQTANAAVSRDEPAR